MIWELHNGGKALWLIKCPDQDINKIIDSFNKMFGVFSGFKAGISTSAIANAKDGKIVGFQVLCLEKAKDDIKKALSLLGIKDSEMEWFSESELRKQFENWKKQQSKAMKRFRSRNGIKIIAQKRGKNSNGTQQTDLFRLIVDENKMHPAFIALRDSIGHVGARNVMNTLYMHMGDPNGNFITDFQSNGFHSRLFEIACYGYLESQGFIRNRTFERPDFLVTRQKNRAVIEAVPQIPQQVQPGIFIG